MGKEDRQKTLEIRFYETVDRLIQKCRVLDEKMLREGKRPIVTNTLRGFIPSHNVNVANIAECMEYISWNSKTKSIPSSITSKMKENLH